MSQRVTIVGSAYMDLVVHAPRFPEPGESVVGTDFEIHAGGKGVHRAVAAARLGATATLVGCVGEDAWGSELRAVLASEGIDLSHFVTHKEQRTGTAVIAVVPGGRTALLGVPGANDRLDVEQVDTAADEIADSRVLILHRGLPEAAAARAISLAKRADVLVILNASPSGPIEQEVLAQVDVLVAREGCARLLAGDGEGVSPGGLARRLHALGPTRIVITRGSSGALAFDGERVVEQEGFSVHSVDSTGTGAAFTAALAVAHAEGFRSEAALRFACAAGALAATKRGGLASLPTREQVDQLVAAGAGSHA